MKPEVYQAVKARSGGRCEAECETPFGWERCWLPATEVHHMLPKSRGGRILDDFGEHCHLIDLCKADHMQAHSRSDAAGLMIDGSVTWSRLTERPEYKGTDPELKRQYPVETIDG